MSFWLEFPIGCPSGNDDSYFTISLDAERGQISLPIRNLDTLRVEQIGPYSPQLSKSQQVDTPHSLSTVELVQVEWKLRGMREHIAGELEF